MKKIITILLLIILLSGCTSNKENNNSNNKIDNKDNNIKFNDNISSERDTDCDYKPKLLFTKDDIKVYTYCVNNITYKDNKLSSDNYSNIYDEVKNINDKDALEDGGTILYKGKEMNILICEQMLDFAVTNKDIYIGDSNMKYKENFCKPNPETKVLTLKVVDIKNDEVTLSRTNEMDTVIYPYSFPIEKGKTYEFEFMFEENIIYKDTIKDAFEMATLVEVREVK